MLYFNRIDASEEIDVNEISASKESDICHYWWTLQNIKLCDIEIKKKEKFYHHKSPVFLKRM